MNPTDFPGTNAVFGPPQGLTEGQVVPIHARVGQMVGGPMDGSQVVTVGWKPSEEDLERMSSGGFIYLSCIGGLPPHYITTDPPV